MTGIAPATTCATSKRLTVWLHTQCPWLDLNRRPPLYQSGTLTNTELTDHISTPAKRCPYLAFQPGHYPYMGKPVTSAIQTL